MRNIIFRGKLINRNGEWGYGDLRRYGGNTWVFPHNQEAAYDADMVDPATVGEFTGLTDKNGKEIWEGDIVMFYGRLAVVIFDDDAAFKAQRTTCVGIAYPLFYDEERKVIGNIYDNPELLYECQR